MTTGRYNKPGIPLGSVEWEFLQTIDTVIHYGTALCNQAALLATHCDALGGAIGPNFSASRSFIRTDIEKTREALEALKERKEKLCRLSQS